MRVEWMDNTVYYETTDILRHRKQWKSDIWAFCNDVAFYVCVCARVRACMCVCVFGWGVYLCVGVFSSSLWFCDLDSELFHSNPGNTAEQSPCGSGRMENKFTIVLLVAEDFSRLHLFRDRWGKRASLVEKGRKHIFHGHTAVLWTSWWYLRLSGLKAVTAGGNSWT